MHIGICQPGCLLGRLAGLQKSVLAIVLEQCLLPNRAVRLRRCGPRSPRHPLQASACGHAVKGLPDGFEAATWAKLQTAVRAVQHKQPVSTSLEELYRVGAQTCSSSPLRSTAEALTGTVPSWRTAAVPLVNDAAGQIFFCLLVFCTISSTGYYRGGCTPTVVGNPSGYAGCRGNTSPVAAGINVGKRASPVRRHGCQCGGSHLVVTAAAGRGGHVPPQDGGVSVHTPPAGGRADSPDLLPPPPAQPAQACRLPMVRSSCLVACSPFRVSLIECSRALHPHRTWMRRAVQECDAHIASQIQRLASSSTADPVLFLDQVASLPPLLPCSVPLMCRLTVPGCPLVEALTRKHSTALPCMRKMGQKRRAKGGGVGCAVKHKLTH